jgi:hypothetical protein
MQRTGAARDNGSNLRGRLLAGVTEHRLTVFALLEEVWQLIITRALPVQREREREKICQSQIQWGRSRLDLFEASLLKPGDEVKPRAWRDGQGGN